MKIFFNTYPVAFQCPGGGEIQLIKSKEALERRGHEVFLFDPWNHKLNDADIIHHFSVQGGTYNLCAYARGQGIPLVISPILWLSDYVDQYPMGEIELMISLADVICPNSEAEIDRFVQHFDIPREKYHVTYNGVEEKFFDAISPDVFRSHFGIEGPFILCVGNIEVRKNQFALVQAAAKIGVKVILLGNVRDQDYFSSMKRELGGKFIYLGYLEHSSDLLRSAYAACSLFALPSLLETPGLAALEAAASGAPIVITAEGCTEEYFGSAAYYVDPKNVDDIAGKIELGLKKNGVNVELRSRTRRFGWDKVAVQLEMAYEKAISRACEAASVAG